LPLNVRVEDDFSIHDASGYFKYQVPA